MKKLAVYGVGILIVLLVAIALVTWRLSQGNSTFVEPNSGSDGAEVGRIAQVCAMGEHTSVDSKVQAGLAKYLSDLHAGATVSTHDVGALVEKITSDQQGVALYKAYTDCLNQQMGIAIAKKGGRFIPSTPAQTEEQNDKTIFEKTSMLVPDTPPQRLAELLGQPISVRNLESDTQVTLYQYKYLIYLADYSRKGRRLGIAIVTRSRAPKSPKDIGQLSVTLKEVDNCYDGSVEKVGVRMSAHRLISTGLCGGAATDNYIYSSYFFYPPDNTSCELPPLDLVRDLSKKCADMAEEVPVAVAMSNDQNDLVKIRKYFTDEMDFGRTFKWASPEDEAAELAQSKANEAAEAADDKHR
jgi:hypothetical protein